MAKDHPRIRGEHDSLSTEKFRARGSSPHTRGARWPPGRRRRFPGIIPAYAGSTGLKWLTSKLTSDHPRIRGEHWPRTFQTLDNSGSSPHTRGARPGRDRQVEAGRIIPAYAGSTIVAWMARHEDAGSSPHTRGARCPARPPCTPGRIIPAYAGSTSVYRALAILEGDHPRIRGEHTWKSLQYQGSPP